MVRDGSLLVEFLGLPGVGKSELSHRVAQRLAGNGIAVRQPSHVLAHGMSPPARRLGKTLYVLREILCHPVAAARTARAIAATGQRDRRTRGLLTFNWLLVVALARRARRRAGIHLLDQGLLQAVWSVAFDGDADGAVRLLSAPDAGRALPDVVVVVEADQGTVRQRLCHRAQNESRLERQFDRATELLAHGDRLLQRIRTALARDCGARIVTVHNEAGTDLDRLADDLAHTLRAMAGGAAPA